MPHPLFSTKVADAQAYVSSSPHILLVEQSREGVGGWKEDPEREHYIGEFIRRGRDGGYG